MEQWSSRFECMQMLVPRLFMLDMHVLDREVKQDILIQCTLQNRQDLFPINKAVAVDENRAINLILIQNALC